MSINIQIAKSKLLTKLKKKVQDMLTSEAQAAHRIGLTPNMVSLIGLALALSSAVAYTGTQGRYQPLGILLATILLLASGFCDALDGIIARIYQQTSVFGGFLDSLLDRYADAAVYAGIIIGGLCNPFWGLAALAGSLLVSYRDKDGIHRHSRKSRTHAYSSSLKYRRDFLASSLELGNNSACGALKPNGPAKGCACL